MKNKTRKILLAAGLIATLFTQTVYAEAITISEAPNLGDQTKVNVDNGNYITSSRTATGKTVSSTGVLKIGSGENLLTSESDTGVGPGHYQAKQGSNENNPILIDSTAAVSNAQTAADSNIAKPEVSSQGAVLYDATTGQVLFEKNSSAALYPASTTKLLTALLTVENLKMDTSFKFSSSATENLESGATNVNMVKDDTMTVKDALHALLLKSACEVANGLAEKVSGSQTAFAELMNKRAKELGCKNSNFVNASGLNNTNHYSTAYDIALILSAVLDKAELRTILQTPTYKLPASKKRGVLTLTNNNKMIAGQSEYYEGFIGGKTGYTSKAGSCLAAGVEYNSHKLIAVALNSNQMHYKDAKAMFDYAKKLIDSNAVAPASNAASAAATTAASTAATTTASGTTTANTTAATTTTSTQTTNTASSQANGGTWEQVGSSWKYKKADGTYAKSMWLDINGNTYFIGADECMCTGWKQFSNGAWYYFNPQNGAMVREKWVTQNDKSYYLNPDGTMAKNTVVDGKYQVDENGVYVKNVG